jgi:hypothetical protein
MLEGDYLKSVSIFRQMEYCSPRQLDSSYCFVRVSQLRSVGIDEESGIL